MPDSLTDDAVSALMPELRAVMREAADIARPFFRLGGQTSARIWSKAGGSPVTEADVAVDAFLKVRLSALVGGPHVERATQAFLSTLDGVTVEELCQQAERRAAFDGAGVTADFTI